MLGSKRQANGSCPGRSESKLVKDDALSVYESTILKLRFNGPPCKAMAANAEPSGGCQDAHTCLCRPEKAAVAVTASAVATQANTAGPSRTGEVSFSACSTSREGPGVDEYHAGVCFHCRRRTCVRCWRRCAQCEEDFCSVCSILDFKERYDRAFCLDCYSYSQITTSK